MVDFNYQPPSTGEWTFRIFWLPWKQYLHRGRWTAGTWQDSPGISENHLNQTIIFRFYVNLRGCTHQKRPGLNRWRKPPCRYPLTHWRAQVAGLKMSMVSQAARRIEVSGLETPISLHWGKTHPTFNRESLQMALYIYIYKPLSGLMTLSPKWWVFPKIGGKRPKMDGENHGTPYFLMDDLGGKPPIFGRRPTTDYYLGVSHFLKWHEPGKI